MQLRLTVATAVATALAACALAAPAAQAHLDFAASSPRNGAVLKRQPALVWVAFTAPILGGSLKVVDGRGRVVSKGKGGRDPRDKKRLRVALKPGKPGLFRIDWSMIGPDAHHQTGSVRFRVRPAG
jgi:methionine-rich copper-binding protein CopC